MKGLIRRIRGLLYWSRVAQAGADDLTFPVQRVSYRGKLADCLMLFPFGFHANLTPDSLLATFAMGGNAEDRVGIGGDPRERPRLAEGEVVVYHPPTGSMIHFRASGDIDITAVGELNVKAEKVTVDAPLSVFTGSVEIQGGLDNTAGEADFGTIRSNGTGIDDGHTHGGVTTGGGSTSGVE